MNTKTGHNKKQQSSFKRTSQLISDYFLHSNERTRAWLLLSGLLVCIIVSVSLKALSIWWAAEFMTALIAKDTLQFKTGLKLFFVLIVAKTIIKPLRNYIKKTLSIYWQQWLTKKLLKKYMRSHVRRSPCLEQLNPEQRVEEEIPSVVNRTLKLGMGFFTSILSFMTFVRTLWILGGSISFVIFGSNICIPGYLVWLALASVAISAIITHMIGSSLAGLNSEEEDLRAAFRKEIRELGTKDNYKVLMAKLKSIINISYVLRYVNVMLSTFRAFSSKLLKILPYIAAGWLYFEGKINIEQLTEIDLSFFLVIKALGWYVDSYKKIAEWKTSVSRVIELEDTLEGDLTITDSTIVAKQSSQEETTVKRPTRPSISCRDRIGNSYHQVEKLACTGTTNGEHKGVLRLG